MKNRNFIKNSMLVLLPISLGLGVLLGVNTKPIEQVSASSYSTSSVPTTIDLNDCTESDVRNYYSALTSKTDSERSGTNLLKNLKPILKNGQKYFSYGSGATTAVWQAYEIVDRDWSKSPASAISGYNSTTNKITGYKYGSSNSSTGSNPYIHALYVNRDDINQTRAWGNHDQDQWGINQEHIWAKSCGFEDKSHGAGARGDLMHLWAGNGRVNGSSHSNYYYGYVDRTKTYDDAGTYASTLEGNLRGYSKTKGGTYTVFEPQDSDKGDIARAIFYMAARYNYLSGSDSDGIDSGNPNLELTNELNWKPGTSYTSSTTKKGQMGILQDLLEWNRLDPPDTWEIHRNNLLYRNFTKNRNPFIDFPEWAEYIWGKSTDGSYSSASTGNANPSSDNINTFSTGGAPTVSSVTVSSSSLSLNLKGTSSAQLSATVVGTNNPSQSVTWTSSNTNVATVNSSGVVAAIGTGNTTIKATSVVDTTKYASCTVSVTNNTVSVTSVTLDKTETTLSVGASQALNETVLPTNASNKSVTWATSDSSVVTVAGGVIHAKSVGTATITVTTDDQDKQATCAVTVEPAVDDYSASLVIGDYADANSWGNQTEHMEIPIDERLTATATRDSGSNTGKYYSSGKNWRFYQNETGKLTLTLDEEYEFDSVTLTFSVENTGSLKYGSNTVTTGEPISVTGSTVTFNVSNSGIATNGQVRFTAISAAYHRIKVLEGISVDASKAKVNYSVNETFSSENLVVTAFYDDETEDEVTDYTVSTPDMTMLGTKTITITYTERNVEVSGTYEITVVSSSGSHSQKIVSNSDSQYFETGSLTLSGTTTSASASSAGFTFTQNKNTGSSIVLTYQTIRAYVNHSLVITPAIGYEILSVVFTGDDENYAKAITNATKTNCSTSREETIVTLTPTDGTSFSRLTFTSKTYIRSVVVNYAEEGTTDPVLTWDAPTIDVYSGATLTSANVSSWNVTYDDGAGSSTKPATNQLTVKLGDDVISIPHVWSSSDDGKALHVEYANISTTSANVTITQSINDVLVPSINKWDYTFDSKKWEAAGDQVLSSKTWNFTGTSNDDTPYFGHEGTRGQQFGSGSHYFTNAKLSTSGFTGTISSVTVYTSGSSGINATVRVSVGGVSYGNAVSINSTNTAYTFDLGGKSGTIEINWVNSSSRALYIKQIVVRELGTPSNVANSASHIAAQRVAVKYANAFNTAMESTEYCTTNLSSAWSTCSSAYNTFLTEAAALGTDEEVYAKNLIKYAAPQYTNDSGEACIERMLKTYGVCVQKHGQTAFMSGLVSLSNDVSTPSISKFTGNKVVTVIIAISVVGIGSIGGYFVKNSRKKEEF